MADEFKYDVFLNHSKVDKVVVSDLANRLLADGVRVWGFDKDEGGRLKDELAEFQELHPSSFHLHPSVEAGLDSSRVLVHCMSGAALADPGAPGLESHTFRFKDPLNHDRRFIPLRLDDAPT